MKLKFAIMCCAILTPAMSANAFEYASNSFSFKFSGAGTLGAMYTDMDSAEYLNDWRVRASVAYAISNTKNLGLTYSVDAIAIDDDNFMRDAFIYFEDKTLARIEAGFTESIARKLGVGLPDVGGLRINDRSLLYKEIIPSGAVITDGVLSTGYAAPRINIASVPIGRAQYGVSLAGGGDTYDYTVDAAVKIRNSDGKIKTAFSVAASFMSHLDNFVAASYLPTVTADSRTQISGGVNVQYNSFIFGGDVRVIYDKNPTGTVSDGFIAGLGASYDILNYSVSLSYLLSDTGVWNSDVDDYLLHTAIASLRYKYSEYVNVWISGGATSETPFVSAGVGISF